MKTFLTFIIILIFIFSTAAQPGINSVNISAGPSWHGTGDLNGFEVTTLYERGYSKRYSWVNGLTTTIHYGKDKGFNSIMPGTSPENRLMPFTTAGLQLNSFAQYYIIAKNDNKLSAFAGTILRFQSSSRPPSFGYVQDQRNYPEPFYIIYDHSKPNTLSPGYKLGLIYKNRIASNYNIGFKAAFQNDTNGDAITVISVMLERLLPKIKEPKFN